MYNERTNCRACGSANLIEVFDLKIQPPANDFTIQGDSRKGYAPLKVNFCEACSLAQLNVVYDPSILYSNYPYVTSRSATMKAHFGRIAKDIDALTPLKECSIMEIGSNDGTLLKYLKELGVKSVLGIEPADNLAAIANANGITTINDFFGLQFSGYASRVDFERPDIIIARHVFAHMDDWKSFISILDQCCHDKTIVFIEVPNTADMLKSNSFDQIYHEHLSYVTPKAVAALLSGTGFHIHGVISYSIHGGAIGIFIRKEAPVIECNLDLYEVTQDDWINFSDRSKNLIFDLSEFVSDETGTFSGYGASAKSSVWINACQWTSKEIGFIVDSTPQKQGRISPGSDIPIVPESELLKRMPDYCIIFSWNFCNEIIANNKAYTEAGGKFIIPIPEIKIV